MKFCSIVDCRFAAQMTDFGQHLPRQGQTA
jgi:hypothetical protein